MPLTQFADTEGNFLFSPSCCSAGSCQLIVVGLLKLFGLRWVEQASLLFYSALCSGSTAHLPHPPVPAHPHPLFLECHTGTGAENWRLCVFSSSYHLAPCEEPGPSPLPPPWVLLEPLLGVLLSHSFSKPYSHSPCPQGKRCHPWQSHSLCCACCSWSKPSLSAVLVWPNKHWAGGGKTPALPFSCGQAAAAALSCQSTLLARALLAVCCQDPQSFLGTAEPNHLVVYPPNWPLLQM